MSVLAREDRVINDEDQVTTKPPCAVGWGLYDDGDDDVPARVLEVLGEAEPGLFDDFEEPVEPVHLPWEIEAAWADERHPLLGRLCDLMHAFSTGEAAKRLLDDDLLPDEGIVLVAPTWTWMLSRVDVGRKDRRVGGGERYLMPVRVSVESGSVLVRPADAGDDFNLSWAAAGLGHSATGVINVRATTHAPALGARVESGQSYPGVPMAVSTPVMSRREIGAALDEIVERSQAARWEIITIFERYVRDSLRRAHASVSIELESHVGHVSALVDQTKMEGLATQMLLGDDTRPGKVLPLIDRCLVPGAFLRVEPLKYIRDSLRRDANQVLRQAIGDPGIGPKIRKVAREVGSRDVDTVVEAYQARYPKDRLSRDRAEAALRIDADPMAAYRSLQWTGHVEN